MDREVEWAKITGFFSDASKLDRQHENSIKEYNRVVNAVNELDELQYWTTDSRREDLDFIENAFEYMDLDNSGTQDSLKEDYDNIVASKETISIYKSFLQKKNQYL